MYIEKLTQQIRNSIKLKSLKSDLNYVRVCLHSHKCYSLDSYSESDFIPFFLLKKPPSLNPFMSIKIKST